MSKFVVTEEGEQVLGKFSTQEAAEVARLEYCRMMARDNNSQLFRKFMEGTLVVKDPEKKKAQMII